MFNYKRKTLLIPPLRDKAYYPLEVHFFFFPKTLQSNYFLFAPNSKESYQDHL